jgi:hypothetical protein
MREYLERMDTAMYVAAEPPELKRVLAALGQDARAGRRTHRRRAPVQRPPEHTARAREILGPGKLLAPEQAVLLETDPVERDGSHTWRSISTSRTT